MSLVPNASKIIGSPTPAEERSDRILTAGSELFTVTTKETGALQFPRSSWTVRVTVYTPWHA